MAERLTHVFIPDTHSGIAGRTWRYALVEGLIRETTRHDAQLCFLGDTLEVTPYCTAHASRLRVDRDSKMKEVLQEYQSATRRPVHVVLGNHDESLNAMTWQEWFGVEAKVHDGLCHFEDVSIVAHHGHALEYADELNPEAVIQELENHFANMHPSQKNAHSINHFLHTHTDLVYTIDNHHRMNMIMLWCLMEILAWMERKIKKLPQGSVDDTITALLEKSTLDVCMNINEKAFIGLKTFYEQLEVSIDPVSRKELFMKISKEKRKLWQRLLHRETLIAEAAARTLGVRGSIAGHTHAPCLTMWHYNDSNGTDIKKMVVGNAGSIYANARIFNADRYAPTCIVVDSSDAVHLRAWNSSTKAWHTKKTEQLPKNTRALSFAGNNQI